MGGGRESERWRDRERDRHRERESTRETYRERERERAREIASERARERERESKRDLSFLGVLVAVPCCSVAARVSVEGDRFSLQKRAASLLHPKKGGVLTLARERVPRERAAWGTSSSPIKCASDLRPLRFASHGP